MNISEVKDATVNETYNAIIKGMGVDWMAVEYDMEKDGVCMTSKGSDGWSGLRQFLLKNSDKRVLFGLACVEGKRCVLVTWLPANLTTDRRTTGLMHSQAVAGMLKHSAHIVASKEEDLSNEHVALRLQPGSQQHRNPPETEVHDEDTLLEENPEESSDDMSEDMSDGLSFDMMFEEEFSPTSNKNKEMAFDQCASTMNNISVDMMDDDDLSSEEEKGPGFSEEELRRLEEEKKEREERYCALKKQAEEIEKSGAEELFAGNLSIQQPANPYWKRRRVVVRGHHLLIYNPNQFDNVPVTILDLSKAERLDFTSPESEEPCIRNGFVMELASEGCYYMYADNRMEVKSAIKNFRSAVRAH